MNLRVLEKKKEKLKVEVTGETHTLLNILREKAWVANARQVSYMIEHPYLVNPKIIVMAKNPKKVLFSAAQMVIDQTKDFKRELRRALKK